MMQIILSVLSVYIANVVVLAKANKYTIQSIDLGAVRQQQPATKYNNCDNVIIANKLMVEADYELSEENDPLHKKYLELSSPDYKSGTNRTIGLRTPSALEIEKNGSTLQAQIHLRNCVFRI